MASAAALLTTVTRALPARYDLAAMPSIASAAAMCGPGEMQEVRVTCLVCECRCAASVRPRSAAI